MTNVEVGDLRLGRAKGGGGQKVHWGMLGVATLPLGVLIAGVHLPEIATIAMAIFGAALVLLSLGIPQGISRRAGSAVGSYLHNVTKDHQIREASELCREAAAVVGALLATVQPVGIWPRLSMWVEKRRVLAAYKRQHRPSVLHAIEFGINAGATDTGTGTLALAERPQDIADLNALHAGLLGMVVALSLSGA